MSNSQDCYFYVDTTQDLPEEERIMSPLCIQCRDEHFPDVGWFWAGSKKGYGPWNYNCKNCGKSIHKKRIKDDTQTTN